MGQDPGPGSCQDPDQDPGRFSELVPARILKVVFRILKNIFRILKNISRILTQDPGKAFQDPENQF